VLVSPLASPRVSLAVSRGLATGGHLVEGVKEARDLGRPAQDDQLAAERLDCCKVPKIDLRAGIGRHTSGTRDQTALGTPAPYLPEPDQTSRSRDAARGKGTAG
jgi:hypothetical protein